MENKNVSAPVVFDIFRVLKDTQYLDVKNRPWHGDRLLHDAMLTYEPNVYRPEVMIKLSTKSPLIRIGIEELEIEETSSTTVLIAEIGNVEDRTKKMLLGKNTLTRTISFDATTGRLIGVAVAGKMLPQSFSVDLLEKAFLETPCKRPVILHQNALNISQEMPVPLDSGCLKGELSNSLSADNPAQDLLSAIKSYLMHTLSPEIPNRSAETKQINKAFDFLSNTCSKQESSPSGSVECEKNRIKKDTHESDPSVGELPPSIPQFQNRKTVINE